MVGSVAEAAGAGKLTIYITICTTPLTGVVQCGTIRRWGNAHYIVMKSLACLIINMHGHELLTRIHGRFWWRTATVLNET